MREFAEEWQGILGLASLFIMILSIVLADPTKKLARIPFALRALGFWVFGCTIFLAGFIFETEIGRTGIIGIFVVVGIALIFYNSWLVHRTQDIGWSRWWNVLTFVPFWHIIWIIILAAVPSKAIEKLPH